MPEQTIDVDSGRVIDPGSRPVTVVRPVGMASMVNIPPQIAVTVFWVAVGFGLCWWLMGKSSSRRSVFDD